MTSLFVYYVEGLPVFRGDAGLYFWKKFCFFNTTLVFVDRVLWTLYLAFHTWHGDLVSCSSRSDMHGGVERPSSVVSACKALHGSDTKTRKLLGWMKLCFPYFHMRGDWFALQANQCVFCLLPPPPLYLISCTLHDLVETPILLPSRFWRRWWRWNGWQQ